MPNIVGWGDHIARGIFSQLIEIAKYDEQKRALLVRQANMGVERFRRYTNLAAAIHMLRTKSITLLNPATCDDTNDAYYMAEYKRLKRANTVLALCFTESEEKYHHWRVFSHGSDGVCIEFDKPQLLSTWVGNPMIKMDLVSYELIKDMRTRVAIDVERLPFLKRHPYKDEREFRVIYVGMNDTLETKSYPIALECIKRITLSPWMSRSLSGPVKDTLKSIPDCSPIRIYQSTLVDNEAWKAFTARAEL